jgi:hypothetical protein
MIKNYFLLALLFLFFGCSSVPTIYRTYSKSYAIVNHGLIDYVPHSVFMTGQEYTLKTIKGKVGDSLLYFASYDNFNLWTGQKKEAYLVYLNLHDSDMGVGAKYDSVWCFAPSVLESYYHDLYNNGMKIKVHKDKSDEAWSRTMNFITRNSDMKVQTSSDYLIDTFNPIVTKKGEKTPCGYTANRFNLGDTTTITIESKGSCGRGLRQAHKFIKYGIDY